MAEWNEILRAARRRLGLTQPQLAARAGVSPATVFNAESGRKPVSRGLLLRTTAALELNAEARDRVLVGAGHEAEPAGRLAELVRRRRPIEEVQGEVATYGWPCLVINERHEIACWNAAANHVAELDFARDLPLLRGRCLMRVAVMDHFRERVLNWELVVGVLIAIMKANQTDIEHPEADSAYFATMIAEIYQNHPDLFPTLIDLWNKAPALPDGGRESFQPVWRVGDGTVLRFNCLATSWSDFDAAWALDWHPADATTWRWLTAAAGRSDEPEGVPPPLTPAQSWRELLRREREATGLTRAALAARGGVSESQIYSIEAATARRTPTRATLLALTRAMELDGIATNAILSATGFDLEPSEWALFLAEERRRTETKKYRPKNDPHRTRFDMQRAIAVHPWPCLIVDERCELLCVNAAAEAVNGAGLAARTPGGTRGTLVRYVLGEHFRAHVANWEEAVLALIPGSLRPYLAGSGAPRPAAHTASLINEVRRLDAAARRRLQEAWRFPVPERPQTRVVFPLVWREGGGAVLSFNCLLSPWNAFDSAWALDWQPADAQTWEWLAEHAPPPAATNRPWAI